MSREKKENFILIAKGIITMDPANPRSKAVGIEGNTGKIKVVGTIEECKKAMPDCKVEDVDGFLMPGFIEKGADH